MINACLFCCLVTKCTINAHITFSLPLNFCIPFHYFIYISVLFFCIFDSVYIYTQHVRKFCVNFALGYSPDLYVNQFRVGMIHPSSLVANSLRAIGIYLPVILLMQFIFSYLIYFILIVFNCILFLSLNTYFITLIQSNSYYDITILDNLVIYNG